MYLVDTCIHYERSSDNEVLKSHWLSTPKSRILICDTVIEEILKRRIETIERVTSGKSKSHGDITDAYRFLINDLREIDAYDRVPYNSAAEAKFQELSVGKPKRQIGDCRIAATAIVHGLIVVTANVRDFSDYLPPEMIEDWTRPDRGKSI